MIITDEGECKKMTISDALEKCMFGSKMQYKTRRFRNKNEKVLNFEMTSAGSFRFKFRYLGI